MRDVHVLVIQDGAMQALGNKSTKDPTSLKCEQCSKTFSRSWLLKNHQRVHTGERPYKCSFCDKAFADKSNLRQHQKIHTTTEKLFQCGICQRTFAQRRYLMKHATEIHRDVSMSMYGSPTAEKKEKEEEPVKHVEKQTTKMSVAAVQTAPEIPNKSANHQYLTRQKSRTKTISESKDEKDTKEKKYSEQDLKDFIKSDQKMMEKNGYIFIKQNFESLDTEPTLTEISEVPITAVPDEVGLKEDSETGNQILNVNGKMVYLQMENKPVSVQALPQNSKATAHGMSESQTQGGISNVLKGRKLVAKKDTGVVRRQANILKAGGAKKGQENISSGNTVKFVNFGNTKQATPRPVQLVPSVPQNTSAEPLTLVQVVPHGTLPVVQNQGPYMIPVTLVQMPHQIQPLMSAPTLSNLKPVTLPSINTISENNASSPANTLVTTDSNPQVIEIQTVPVAVDEKGAAGDISGSQVVTSTPIVSDAPWQGIVNINSEQELLEYISSNSQTMSTVETDQGMTILIQNVDSQNGTVMSLDSQSLLSGSGNFSSVFHDQAAIISEVLPESGNINEVQINTDEGDCQESNQNVGESNNEINTEKDNTVDNNLVIKEEASNDSDDAQSQVMLTEANREHLSDQEDFTDDQNDKMLIKSENECDPEPFSDHTMYTAHEVKCEIEEKADELMETEDCDSDGMVIDNPGTENNIEAKDTEFKEQA